MRAMKQSEFSSKTLSDHSESGNVLFLILIAVALFAALTYVVGQSTRSGAGNTSSERAKLIAAQILNYAASVATGITRVETSNCKTEQISFEAPPFDGSDANDVNPNSPTDFHCHIFHPNGGGVIHQDAPPDVQEIPAGVTGGAKGYYFSGADQVRGVGTDDQGNFNSESKEFTMFLPYINVDVCKALNKDIRMQDVAPPVDLGTVDITGWEGDFETSGAEDIADTDEHLKGAFMACFQATGVFGPTGATSGGYHFYNVLMAR